MRALIVGCGYVGFPLAAELARQGHEVFGLRRSASTDAALQAAGIKPLQADITAPDTLTKLPREFDWVVNCVASGGGDVEAYRQLYLQGMRNLVAWLIPRSAGILPASSSNDATATRRQDASAPRIVYTSSTGVYGQNDGSLVDETSPTEPATETAKVLVETEKLLLAAGREKKFPAMILRAAGIYGPERGYLLKQFLRGEARIEGDGARTLNMIHRTDLIRAIIAALKVGQAGQIYNAVDDEPVSQLEFFTWLATKLSQPLPPTAPEDATAPRKRGLTNKRISNRKLRTELSFTFKYPDYRSGYSAELERLALRG
ncbi:MAG: SDR family oxidoreductase [Verrucomicrobiota bacterium]